MNRPIRREVVEDLTPDADLCVFATHLAFTCTEHVRDGVVNHGVDFAGQFERVEI